jgi:hypothetical protein
MDPNSDAPGTCFAIIARKGPLAVFIELTLRIKRERMRGYDDTVP